MKLILLCVLTLFITVSCHYKELGCVICHTKKREKIVTTFDNGQVRSIRKVKTKTKAIDTPVMTISRYREFDTTGVLIKKRKSWMIRSVWDFERQQYETKEIAYYPKSDSIKKEVTVFKDGKVVLNKKVKR